MGGRRAVSAHFHSSNMSAIFFGGGGGGWKEGSVSFPFPYTVL